jgi:hypothetical protein
MKKKGKRTFPVSVKTPKGTEKKAALKDTTEIALLRGSARQKLTIVPSCQQTVLQQVSPVLKKT